MKKDDNGWTDREGILWRSKGGEVIVSSKYMRTDKEYRIVVNDEIKGKQQKVLKTKEEEKWLELVLDAIKFAEGYYLGKKRYED